MKIEIIIAAISVFVGIGTFVLTTWYKRLQNRRDATFEMLRTIIFESGPIYEANLKFAMWCSEGRSFPDDRIADPEDARTVIELLNFFDLIADSATRKIIDKTMVIAHLGGRMKTALALFDGYIKARRVTLERQFLYKSLETFLIENATELSRV